MFDEERRREGEAKGGGWLKLGYCCKHTEVYVWSPTFSGKVARELTGVLQARATQTTGRGRTESIAGRPRCLLGVPKAKPMLR